jgi:transcriptional regulator with XRE-family HTH domain
MAVIDKEQIRDLLRRGNLTQAAAATMAGVNIRTVRRWLSGESAIPYSAWLLLFAQVDQAAIIAQAAGENPDTAWAKDIEWVARSPLEKLESRIWTTKGILQMQQRRCQQLEDDLAAERHEIAATTSMLNALLAERGQLEKG